MPGLSPLDEHRRHRSPVPRTARAALPPNCSVENVRHKAVRLHQTDHGRYHLTMIRTQVSLTEEQMKRLRGEARRRRVSLAALIRDAVDRAVPGEDAERSARMDALLEAAGSASSGSGTVASNHDDVLGDERW